VKAIGRIGHSVSGQDVEVLIDQEQVAGGDLVESQAESLRVESAGLFSPRGDLSGQSRVVSAIEQCAARQRHLLAQRPVITPRARDRSMRRIVTGGAPLANPTQYVYTGDHYDSFCLVADAGKQP
jgi:hypothetical protein